MISCHAGRRPSFAVWSQGVVLHRDYLQEQPATHESPRRVLGFNCSCSRPTCKPRFDEPLNADETLLLISPLWGYISLTYQRRPGEALLSAPFLFLHSPGGLQFQVMHPPLYVSRFARGPAYIRSPRGINPPSGPLRTGADPGRAVARMPSTRCFAEGLTRFGDSCTSRA